MSDSTVDAMVEALAQFIAVGVNGLTEKGWTNVDGDGWLENVKVEARKEARSALALVLPIYRAHVREMIAGMQRAHTKECDEQAAMTWGCCCGFALVPGWNVSLDALDAKLAGEV